MLIYSKHLFSLLRSHRFPPHSSPSLCPVEQHKWLWKCVRFVLCYCLSWPQINILCPLTLLFSFSRAFSSFFFYFAFLEKQTCGKKSNKELENISTEESFSFHVDCQEFVWSSGLHRQNDVYTHSSRVTNVTTELPYLSLISPRYLWTFFRADEKNINMLGCRCWTRMEIIMSERERLNVTWFDGDV